MSRLTRKTNGKDYCLYCDCIEMENAIFEKKQELLSPEEYYKEEPYKMEYGYYYEDAMNRLGKLEDIEEELGCPLEVVFKALKDGIVDIENHEHRYIHLRDNGTNAYPKGWIFHTYHFSYVFKLSDYQKTWWLKGEKDETCNGTD